MTCAFCLENPTEGYFYKYCKGCADLRRMLVLHDATECIEILRKVLLRNTVQIDNQITKHLKDQIQTEIKIENNRVLRKDIKK